MSERVLDLGQGLEIWRCHVDELIEQDVNARAMKTGMFERLAQTIGKDKRLESLPFCARTEKGIEIVSGHHRVRGARSAGVSEIYVILDVSGLSQDQIRAKQLAHNAIEGEDNEQLVRKIYESIADVDKRLEAYIDPERLGMKMEKVKVGQIDLGLEYRTALIVFLPFEEERFQQALEAMEKVLGDSADPAYVAELKVLERWKTVLKRIGKEYDIRSLGTVVCKMADMVLEQLGEEPEAEAVALRDLFGVSMIPAGAAPVIEQAIERMMERGTVTKKNKWQALEYLAAEYLGGR